MSLAAILYITRSNAWLKELERTGIRRTDKRLSSTMKNLRQFQEEDGSLGRALNCLKLNKEVFKRVIRPDFQLIAKAFKNQFIIPQFEDFCRVIRDIYEDCRGISEGKVATYIPQVCTNSTWLYAYK